MHAQQQLNLQHAQALHRATQGPPGILTQLKSLSAGTEISQAISAAASSRPFLAPKRGFSGGTSHPTFGFSSASPEERSSPESPSRAAIVQRSNILFYILIASRACDSFSQDGARLRRRQPEHAPQLLGLRQRQYQCGDPPFPMATRAACLQETGANMLSRLGCSRELRSRPQDRYVAFPGSVRSGPRRVAVPYA